MRGPPDNLPRIKEKKKGAPTLRYAPVNRPWESQGRRGLRMRVALKGVMVTV